MFLKLMALEKIKIVPHYKLKYEMHIFEQRGSVSHWPIIKKRTQKSLLLLNTKGEKNPDQN